ncbi:unnamed protein product, partial [Notodromas monacha]
DGIAEYELNFERASPTVRVHRHVQVAPSLQRSRSQPIRAAYPPVFARFRRTSPSLASDMLPFPPFRESSRNVVTLQKWSRLHKVASPTRSRSCSPAKEPAKKDAEPKKTRSSSTETTIKSVRTKQTKRSAKPELTGNGKTRKKRGKEDETMIPVRKPVIVEAKVVAATQCKTNKSLSRGVAKTSKPETISNKSYHARCGTPVEKDPFLPTVKSTRKKPVEKKREDVAVPPPPPPPMPPSIVHNMSFSPQSRDTNETGYGSMLEITCGSPDSKADPGAFQRGEDRSSRGQTSPRQQQSRRCQSLENPTEVRLTGYSARRNPVTESVFRRQDAGLKRTHSTLMTKSSHPDVYYTRPEKSATLPKSTQLVKQAVKKRESSDPRGNTKTGAPNMSILASIDPNKYHRYIYELFHSSQKSDKFQRLKKLYFTLEKVASLEKTATNAVLLQLARENLIDFDNWKQFRATQRAKSELEDLRGQLETAQKERNFHFRCKDERQVRWRGDMNLRLRDSSVEDLRQKFSNNATFLKPRCASVPKDTYKPLWRSSSVQNVARRFDSIEKQHVESQVRQSSPSPTRRAWSLSTDQLTSLRGQLDGILAKSSRNSRPRKPAKCSTLPLPKKPAEVTKCEEPAFASMTSPRTMSSMTLSEDQTSNADKSSFVLVLNPPGNKCRGLSESTDSFKSGETVVKPTFDSRVKFFEQKGLITPAPDIETGLHTLGLEQDQRPLGNIDALNLDVKVSDSQKAPIEMTRHYVPVRTVSSLDLTTGTDRNKLKPFVMHEKVNRLTLSSSIEQEQLRTRSLDRSCTKYNRTYLSTVKCGDVLRMRHKIEARRMIDRQVERDLAAKRKKTQSASPKREERPENKSPKMLKRGDAVSVSPRLLRPRQVLDPEASRTKTLSRIVKRISDRLEKSHVVYGAPRSRSSPDLVVDTGPCAISTPLSSPVRQSFASQPFDPSKHRPKERYTPPPVIDTRSSRHCQPRRVDSGHNIVGVPYVPHVSSRRANSWKGPVQKYQESEVNIHYRTPVRLEEKTWIPEQQLRMQQEAALRKRYQEERRKKYLQELQDSEMRRHQDYMRPPPVIIQRPRWSEDKRITARALYDFHAQNAKELSFMKGDLIYVGRRIDKNWYEGERHASRGIFPVSYVELMNGPWMNNPGQAMAKYAFVPQLPNEIGFSKGEHRLFFC